MIVEIIEHRCEKCESEDLMKNGHNATGKQKYKCRSCRFHGIIGKFERAYSEEVREEVIRLYRERVSKRGISRITNISLPTISDIIKKKQ